MNKIHFIPLLFLLLGMILLNGCKEKMPMPGTLARVNGEDIHLNSVLAFIDSRTAALGVEPRPSVAEMQKTYAEAVAILIAHALVRQDLESRGLAVSDAELEDAIASVKEDYGENAEELFLADTTLREDEWRQLMRDHLSLEVFTNRILIPSIHISLSEIKEYYNAHKSTFQQPDRWHLCLKSGEDKTDVENWCSHLPIDPGNDEHCMAVHASDIPAPWQGELKKIRIPGCGRIIEQDGQWRSVAILNHVPAKNVTLAEVYPLLENILLEERKEAAFAQWLEQKLAHSTIQTFPGILQPEKTDKK